MPYYGRPGTRSLLSTIAPPDIPLTGFFCSYRLSRLSKFKRLTGYLVLFILYHLHILFPASLVFRMKLKIVVLSKNEIFVGGSLTQRTTCIKAQKWPPTKLTHIVMNNSCVVPLTETGMEIGDRHYIWGQNRVKGYDP